MNTKKHLQIIAWRIGFNDLYSIKKTSKLFKAETNWAAV